MSALERMAISALGTTLFGYLAAIGNRYFIQNNPIDGAFFFLCFVVLLRTKIGLDDIHYYRQEVKKTTHVAYAVATSLLSYLGWFFIPFQVFQDFKLGFLLTSGTILLSTASIAFTGIGLETALKQAKGNLTDVAITYSALKRFYDEQPYWIIMNCLYEALLLILVYFFPIPQPIFAVVLSLLIGVAVYDAHRSASLGYLTGVKKSGIPIHCSNSECRNFLGNHPMHDKYCPVCGSKAETNGS